MITLTADWLRDHWQRLVLDGSVPLPLSRWDGGDALTLAEIGPLPAHERVTGAMTLADVAPRDAQVGVALVPTMTADPDETTAIFAAPDGQRYQLRGWLHDDRGSRHVVGVQLVEVTEALEERRSVLLESSLLRDARVTVIGVGTGGVHVALELAKAGVGHFTLLDPDRLDVGNVARHHAGVSHAGRRKVYVARDLILEKNPEAQVETHAVAVGPDTEELLRGEAARTDAFVCATDSRPSKLFVNRVALAAGKAAIYGGAFRRAYGGQVLRVRPGASPCYQCFVMAMPDEAADQEVTAPTDSVEIAYSDRPVPVEPGLSLDVAPIALMVARLVIQELVAGKGSTLSVLDRDLAAPWYLWLNRPEADTRYADLPPLSESVDEMTILRWYGIHFDRDPACPACGDFVASVAAQHGVSERMALELPERPSSAALPEEE